MTPQAHAASAEALASAAVVSQPQRALMFPVKLFWGMIFCQGLAGSILVVGWTCRLAQRAAFKFWFSRSQGAHTPEAFVGFVAGQETTRAHVHWPNWFAQENFRQAARPQPELNSIGNALRLLQALGNSLWLNFWVGLRAILNTWAVTMPACLFWWFGWYDGWNNSFNKGYEQAAVGPLISLLGIAWFIAAMFYLPLAQARQAVTGEWRSFYQFRLIWAIARERWIYCVILAALYTLLSIPLSILKTSPMFWMHSSSALSSLTSAQVIASLKGYFFWCALVVLPAYVSLRLVAARVYASGLLSLIQKGKLAQSELACSERDVLDRLGLLSVRAQPQRHAFVRFIAWTGTRLGRGAGAIILALVWFSFVAQIYIAEFLNYHSGLGWINQPLVQLPWFRYLPTNVRNPMGEVFWAVLVLLVALLIRSIARSFRWPKLAGSAKE